MELSGFEPLTPSMPLRCATNCAIAPCDALKDALYIALWRIEAFLSSYPITNYTAVYVNFKQDYC